MACYWSVTAGMWDMGFCCLEGGTSWEQCWTEVGAGKCAQTCSKDDKERWWHTAWLDW